MAANLWSDEQKSHQAIAKDKVAIQTMQKCSTTLRSKITEKSGVITDYWTNNLLDLILRKDNLNEAYKQVKRNKESNFLMKSGHPVTIILIKQN